MAHHRIGDHARGQLAETNHDLLGRGQRADFDIGQIQSRLERRQNHRIELLEPVNDKMAGGENPEEPDALFAHGADRRQKICRIHPFNTTCSGRLSRRQYNSRPAANRLQITYAAIG